MTAWGTLMRIGFWVFTEDMEIRRELEKRGTARGSFPVVGSIACCGR
jgi:hypothetical protein